jgi:hypothetical protein
MAMAGGNQPNFSKDVGNKDLLEDWVSNSNKY